MEPIEILRDYVAKNGLKVTRQRELIAEVFFREGGHLSAEELLNLVRVDDARVSLATVYRTLKLLSDCGLAEARNFGGGQTRFEPAHVQEEHHDHLICERCGKIVEFIDERIEKLQEKVAQSHGFSIRHHKMELYGLCSECAPSQKKRAG
jgi:Fur family ferric uptake transcriptional regulator